MATLYMDAVLRPSRSLSKVGFYWLIGLLVAYNIVVAIFLLVVGALPVPPFLLIDIVGVLIAFNVSYRRAGQAERVQVSAEAVTVFHEVGKHVRKVWASPTAFTRVSVEDRGEHEAHVRLHLSRQQLSLARALSPAEREAFADALEDAIKKARAERY